MRMYGATASQEGSLIEAEAPAEEDDGGSSGSSSDDSGGSQASSEPVESRKI